MTNVIPFKREQETLIVGKFYDDEGLFHNVCCTDQLLWRIAAIFCFITFIAEFIVIGVLSTEKQEIQHQLNEIKIKYYNSGGEFYR